VGGTLVAAIGWSTAPLFMVVALALITFVLEPR
jgi:hypothetical protein